MVNGILNIHETCACICMYNHSSSPNAGYVRSMEGDFRSILLYTIRFIDSFIILDASTILKKHLLSQMLNV